MDIEDDYEHLDPSIDYVLENVLMDGGDSRCEQSAAEFQELRALYNSQLLASCNCRECCDDGSCDHGNSYALSPETNELGINTEKTFGGSIIECNSRCSCPPTKCRNRLVQKGPRARLEVFQSLKFRSAGLRTLSCITQGSFVCEYAGELLTRSEAMRRAAFNDENGKANYIVCLREHTQLEGTATPRLIATTFIDPSVRGNIGRYLNHSCAANCELLAVRIDCPIPKIGIFAKRDIEPKEELTFHYGQASQIVASSSKSAKPCLCSAPNCSGFLPNTEF